MCIRDRSLSYSNLLKPIFKTYWSQTRTFNFSCTVLYRWNGFNPGLGKCSENSIINKHFKSISNATIIERRLEMFEVVIMHRWNGGFNDEVQRKYSGSSRPWSSFLKSIFNTTDHVRGLESSVVWFLYHWNGLDTEGGGEGVKKTFPKSLFWAYISKWIFKTIDHEQGDFSCTDFVSQEWLPWRAVRIF